MANLAGPLRVSPRSLVREFQNILGISPRQYADALRIARFKTAVKGSQNVADALYEAGFGSSSRLYEQAVQRLGMTPFTYKKGGKGTRMHYTLAPCSFGLILVAATENGVCTVRVSPSRWALESCLRTEYSTAEIYRDQGSLADWVRSQLPLIDRKRSDMNLPLQIRMTAFEKQVWSALKRTPYMGPTALIVVKCNITLDDMIRQCFPMPLVMCGAPASQYGYPT
ncbi:MAG: helix-turn-helix domain-containing protein [Burkholderiales bacterium]